MALKFKLGEMRTKVEKIILMIDSDDSEMNDLAFALVESMMVNPGNNYLELAKISHHFATCTDAKYITHRNTQSPSFIKIRGLIGNWRMEHKKKDDNYVSQSPLM